MINYNWNCKTVDVKPTDGDLSDVVYNVHWRVEASKGDISTTSIGTKQIEIDEDADFEASTLQCTLYTTSLKSPSVGFTSTVLQFQL